MMNRESGILERGRSCLLGRVAEAWNGGHHAWLSFGLLVIITITGASLRFSFAPRPSARALVGDEIYYVGVAINIASGNGHQLYESSKAWRPPAFPYLLSRVAAVEPPLNAQEMQRAIGRFMILQIALGTLLIPVVFFLGRVFFDRSTGLVAAALAAFHPELVGFSHMLWSETLFGLLVASAVVAVWHGFQRTSRLLAVASGILFGLAGLTREVGVLVAGICALWGIIVVGGSRRRAALACAVLMLAAMAMVILPWSYRNYKTLERLVPVATVGWFATAEGNSLDPENWRVPISRRGLEFRQRYFEIADEAQKLEFARAHALKEIREAQPTWILKKTVLAIALLFQPDSLVAKKLAFGSYNRILRARTARLVVAVNVAAIASLLVVSALGFFTSSEWRAQLLVAAMLIAVVGTHVVSTSSTRFRVPWSPFLLVFAGFALAHGRVALRGLRGWRVVAVVLSVLIFAGVCLPHFLEYSYSAAVWKAAGQAGPIGEFFGTAPK